jgi:hypothetical protein
MRANELESSELHQQPLHVSLKFAECRLPVPVIEPYAFVASFFRQFLRTISELKPFTYTDRLRALLCRARVPDGGCSAPRNRSDPYVADPIYGAVWTY